MFKGIFDYYNLGAGCCWHLVMEVWDGAASDRTAPNKESSGAKASSAQRLDLKNVPDIGSCE